MWIGGVNLCIGCMNPLDDSGECYPSDFVSRDVIRGTDKNELVLIDFGSARVRNMEMTKSMTVVFKRGYSPEEQYRAEDRYEAIEKLMTELYVEELSNTGERNRTGRKRFGIAAAVSLCLFFLMSAFLRDRQPLRETYSSVSSVSHHAVPKTPEQKKKSKTKENEYAGVIS